MRCTSAVIMKEHKLDELLMHKGSQIRDSVLARIARGTCVVICGHLCAMREYRERRGDIFDGESKVIAYSMFPSSPRPLYGRRLWGRRH